MPRQAGIKAYFLTDKAIQPAATQAAPDVAETPDIPPAPPDPPELSIQVVQSVPETPSAPTTPFLPVALSTSETSLASGLPSAAVSTPLKRRGSKTLQSDSKQKRLRTRATTRDSGTCAASADPEDDFPDGPVTVWAMTRGDLCSSQQTFKQYQGGAQTKNNVVTAVYIDKFAEPRDFLGRNKLITCNGGGRKKNNKGRYVRKDIKPSVVRRWKAALHTPIVVVMGKGHPAYPNLNLPSVVRNRGAFVELGTFMVTKVWCEKVQQDHTDQSEEDTDQSEDDTEQPEDDTDQSDKGKTYKVWKIMLQTLEPTSKPWYWKEGVLNAIATDDTLQPVQKGAQPNDSTQSTAAAHLAEATCISCRSTSPKIFDNAPWVCLKDDCHKFFTVGSNILSQIGDDDKELRYCQDFIDHTTTYEKIKNTPTMFEQLPKALVEGGGNFGTEAARRNGMTCPHCRCASSRKFWDKLVCRNCGFEHSAPPLPYPLSLVEKETKTHTKRSGVKGDGVTIKLQEAHVDLFVEKDGGLSTRFIYMIKDDDGHLIGTFVVERPSDLAKKAPGGADEIYTSIEAEGASMKLKRNPARCPDSVNETLTAHFQSNFGALYEFGPKGIDTEPFDNAPDVVLQSLVYLKHFGQKALHSSQEIASRENYTSVAGSTLHTPQQPFNELLALGYRQSDHISWHDDGEGPLTGVISTGSFGSPGKMALRFKVDKKQKKKGTKKSKGEYTEDCDKAGLVILEVQLRHGDVATMCDTRLQALTDHAVDPKGMRRYAMTSRTINFDYYRQAKEKDKLLLKGMTVEDMEKAAQIPNHALNFAYNGTTLSNQREQPA